jgi:receptor-type tyrosine-protein phosphatase beta
LKLKSEFVIAAPDPPSNLSVSVRSGKIALITWSPPTQGNFSSFKLKILGLSDYQYANKTILIDDDSFQYQMKDLTPGATYQIQAYTIFDGKESVAYTSRNFTTSELNFA